MRNDQNTGYSAGNNIGIRYAVEVGCDAVLILNPDIRITDPNYLATLSTEMQIRPECLIAASRIINLSGLDEHPLRLKKFLGRVIVGQAVSPTYFWANFARYTAKRNRSSRGGKSTWLLSACSSDIP